MMTDASHARDHSSLAWYVPLNQRDGAGCARPRIGVYAGPSRSLL